MDNLEIAKETVHIFFEEEDITVEEAFEKAKRMCLGVDQNNQSTEKHSSKL